VDHERDSLGLTVIEADSGHELGTRASSASRIRSSLTTAT
jgi:hypothetical protein